MATLKTSIKVDRLLISAVGENKWIDTAKYTREATAKYAEADATKNSYNNVLGKVIEESIVQGEKTISFQIANFSPEIVQLFKGGTVTTVAGDVTYTAPTNGNQVIEKSIKIVTAKGIVFEYPRVTIASSISIADDDLHYINVMGTVLEPADETADMKYTVLSDASKALNTITSFKINGVAGTIVTGGTNTIAITLPLLTDKTTLFPDVITSLGAVYSPQGATDFTSPVVYTVKSVSGLSKSYTVTVTLA